MSSVDQNVSCKDLKQFNIKELKELSCQLRRQIIDTTKKNGGHLSSNLGIVDTTVALYHVFDFPKDKLIFDVGHQCYAHKILSNRQDEFGSIRKEGGLSGFPSREESEFDPFTTGHAGSSISSGLGLATARDKLKEDYSVITVVGDGSFVNGLNLEALTSSNKKPKNLIIIFNDNGMSISSNKNGFYNLLSKGTTKKWYIKNKNFIKKIFGESFISRWLCRFRDFIKRTLNKNGFVEKFGFKYVGVIDGHDMSELVSILRRVKNVSKNKAVFLHVKTTKGKGLDVAEEHADVYHGVGKNHETDCGEFSTAVGETISRLIDEDDKIIAITAGMKDGTGLSKVEKDHPQSFIDVGIAEEYAVTMAGGLSAGGLKPIVAIYSTFMQRAYDQIMHDVCLQNLPVVFCLDRAGFVGADGKTHQGLFDLSYMLHMPMLNVFAPANTVELENCIRFALQQKNSTAIRYPKSNPYCYKSKLPINRWEVVAEGKGVTILAVGPRMLSLAMSVKESLGEKIRVVNARAVKPIDSQFIDSLESSEVIVTLEENSVIGGFGAYFACSLTAVNKTNKVVICGAKDDFVLHGTIDSQLKQNELDKETLIKKIQPFIIEN